MSTPLLLLKSRLTELELSAFSERMFCRYTSSNLLSILFSPSVNCSPFLSFSNAVWSMSVSSFSVAVPLSSESTARAARSEHVSIHCASLAPSAIATLLRLITVPRRVSSSFASLSDTKSLSLKAFPSAVYVLTV